MSRFQRNLMANYVGQAWSSLAGLVFVPLYIRYLGMEAYGVIGLFTLIQVWLTLLDIGMSPTLSREMARYTSGMRDLQSTSDLLRTLELLCFGIAFTAGFAIWCASGTIARHWLHTESLPANTVSHAIAVMAVVAALRFVESTYRGALLGLQRQVWYNTVNAILATLRWGGSGLALAWLAPTLEVFFFCQALASLLSVMTLAIGTHFFLGRGTRPARFSRVALSEVWKFAGGMTGITILSLLLSQLDKVLLTRLLSLEAFAYYSLAATLAGTIYTVVTPMTAAVFPRMVGLSQREHRVELAGVYHQTSQLISVLIAPMAVLLIIFGGDAIFAWTGKADIAAQTAPILSALALGTALNAIMTIPYQSQLSQGWTSLVIKMNTAAICVLVPAIFWVAPRFGALGVAWLWCILNGISVLMLVHFTHRRILPGEKKDWYFQDVIPPLGAAVLFGLAARFVAPAPYRDRLFWIAFLVLVGLVSLILSCLAANRIRRLLLEKLARLLGKGATPGRPLTNA